MKKRTKILEEKLNGIMTGCSDGKFEVEKLLDEIANATDECPELIIRLTKGKDNKIQVKVSQRSSVDIGKKSKEELEILLEEYEDKLGEIESEEPDEDDLEAYAEWEDEVDSINETISEIEEKLEELEENIAENDIDLPRPKQKDCPTEKFVEFFNVAKSVLLDNEDKKVLLDYLESNDALKDSIIFVCELIEKTNSVSISLIQRRMQIGYNKAGIIVDGLENIGIVTPFNGTSSRKIIVEQLKKLKDILNEN